MCSFAAIMACALAAAAFSAADSPPLGSDGGEGGRTGHLQEEPKRDTFFGEKAGNKNDDLGSTSGFRIRSRRRKPTKVFKDRRLRITAGMYITLQGGTTHKYCDGVTAECTATKPAKLHYFLVVAAKNGMLAFKAGDTYKCWDHNKRIPCTSKHVPDSDVLKIKAVGRGKITIRNNGGSGGYCTDGRYVITCESKVVNKAAIFSWTRIMQKTSRDEIKAQLKHGVSLRCPDSFRDTTPACAKKRGRICEGPGQFSEPSGCGARRIHYSIRECTCKVSPNPTCEYQGKTWMVDDAVRTKKNVPKKMGFGVVAAFGAKIDGKGKCVEALKRVKRIYMKHYLPNRARSQALFFKRKKAKSTASRKLLGTFCPKTGCAKGKRRRPITRRRRYMKKEHPSSPWYRHALERQPSDFKAWKAMGDAGGGKLNTPFNKGFYSKARCYGLAAKYKRARFLRMKAYNFEMAARKRIWAKYEKSGIRSAEYKNKLILHAQRPWHPILRPGGQFWRVWLSRQETHVAHAEQMWPSDGKDALAASAGWRKRFEFLLEKKFNKVYVPPNTHYVGCYEDYPRPRRKQNENEQNEKYRKRQSFVTPTMKSKASKSTTFTLTKCAEKCKGNKYISLKNSGKECYCFTGARNGPLSLRRRDALRNSELVDKNRCGGKPNAINAAMLDAVGTSKLNALHEITYQSEFASLRNSTTSKLGCCNRMCGTNSLFGGYSVMWDKDAIEPPVCGQVGKNKGISHRFECLNPACPIPKVVPKGAHMVRIRTCNGGSSLSNYAQGEEGFGTYCALVKVSVGGTRVVDGWAKVIKAPDHVNQVSQAYQSLSNGKHWPKSKADKCAAYEYGCKRNLYKTTTPTLETQIHWNAAWIRQKQLEKYLGSKTDVIIREALALLRFEVGLKHMETV